MTEIQGSGIRAQRGDQPEMGSGSQGPDERVLELEAENARLKSLIGELLVANQLLREDRSQGTTTSHGTGVALNSSRHSSDSSRSGSR